MGTHLISTDGIAASDRLEWWGERIWGLIGKLKSDAYGDPLFAGSIEYGEMGFMTMCRLQASRHRVVRTPELIRSSDRAFIKVVAQLRGHACFGQSSQEQAGRSITDIALSWGYNSPAHFSRVFRKEFGMTPREWREKARSPDAIRRAWPGGDDESRAGYGFPQGLVR